MTTLKNVSEKEIIKEYLFENIDLEEFEDDLDIFESGMANSLFAIQLMTYLEKEFKIQITMDDLNIENYSTINSITEFVINKKNKE
ncbi:MAG: acyl carrier protein [Bacteroidales bacterium]|nr:acyl carrier protein [Bacteroidales bacterium]